MNSYQATVIVRPDMQEDGARKVEQDINSLISKNGGKVKESELSPRQRLAYKISKFDEGYYIKMLFDYEANRVEDLDRHLSLNQKLLRHMILKG